MSSMRTSTTALLELPPAQRTASSLPRARPRRLRCAPLAAKKGGGGAAKGPKKSLLETPSAPSSQPCAPLPYQSPLVVFHTLTLIDSFRRTAGRALLPSGAGASIGSAPGALWEAPAAVVSHGTEADPVFNYGNAAALHLWGLDWKTFTAMPSRRSAADDPSVQAERSAALAASLAQGVAEGYTGVRVTSTGRRFRIEGATLWQVHTPQGEGLEQEGQGASLGQAATFSEVTWLDGPVKEGEVGAPGERWRFTGGPGGSMERVTEDQEVPVAAPAPAPAVLVSAAAVEEAGAAVRALKAEGRGKEDEELAAAVAHLLDVKAQLAAQQGV